MKVIDIFNKIANGEEVPKKIYYDGFDLIYDEDLKNYYDIDGMHEMIDSSISLYLNDEVEIIEEEKKIPEKLTPFEAPFLKGDKPDIRFRLIIDQINEIIDYLQSKGE